MGITKRSISFWQFVGFIFTSVAGTLLHFLYDWSNNSPVAGLFSAVNESIWEHMKLLFVPLMLFAVVERQFFKDREDFWGIKLLGTLSGLALIPVLYYTYTGIFGVSADWFNITIFFLAAAAVFLLEAYLFKRNSKRRIPSTLALAVLIIIASAFVIFTFAPPHIPLFQDPVTGGYGM